MRVDLGYEGYEDCPKNISGKYKNVAVWVNTVIYNDFIWII